METNLPGRYHPDSVGCMTHHALRVIAVWRFEIIHPEFICRYCMSWPITASKVENQAWQSSRNMPYSLSKLPHAKTCTVTQFFEHGFWSVHSVCIAWSLPFEVWIHGLSIVVLVRTLKCSSAHSTCFDYMGCWKIRERKTNRCFSLPTLVLTFCFSAFSW